MLKNSGLEIQDIFNRYGEKYRKKHGHSMPRRKHRAMRAIEICRTAELGGHIDQCDSCKKQRISYNSCRNRHCPKCQFLKKEQWLENRLKDFLPIQYFHIVFTIPNILNPLVLRNQKVLYNILFKSASETLKELASDKKHIGAAIGFIAVLHTWSQNLMEHPHLHCIVTGGGLAEDGNKWIPSRNNYFIPVKVMSRLFRGKFLSYLNESYKKSKLIFPGTISDLHDIKKFSNLVSDCYRKEWIVYSKPPFKNPVTVFQYLSRYTHRIAISNQRILAIENDKVYFKWRDYADDNNIKVMALDSFEFIRRFLLHILPDRFVKIRHYGLFGNRYRKIRLENSRKALGVNISQHEPEIETWQEKLLRLTGIDLETCPYCKSGKMLQVETLLPSNCNSP